MLINKMQKLVNDRMLVLKNERVRYIGRAGNIVWIGFGEDVLCENYRGEKRILAKYSLHIQGPFRVSYHDDILVGDVDIFNCNKKDDNFDWEHIGESIFDEQVAKISSILKENINVIEVIVSKCGDLKLVCSKEFIIEVFINGICDSEMWRFFENGKPVPHLVRTGSKCK